MTSFSPSPSPSPCYLGERVATAPAPLRLVSLLLLVLPEVVLPYGGVGDDEVVDIVAAAAASAPACGLPFPSSKKLEMKTMESLVGGVMFNQVKRE